MTHETLVLGGGPTGLEIATELTVQNRSVAFADAESSASRAREAGLTTHESTLETAKPSIDCSAVTVVVATSCDARNLLLATAAPHAFDADRVIALVNDPDRRAAFDDAGIETICVSETVARTTTDFVTAEEPMPSGRTTDESVSMDTEEPTPADRTTEGDDRVRLGG
jgi:Trk K+ transport system NAD-binding subunit